MDQKDKLKELVKSIQKSVENDEVTSYIISGAIEALNKIHKKYVYDHDKFPKLLNTDEFKDDSTDKPSNLAEALLWKLGKWKSYKKFAEQFTNDQSKSTKTDVVFFAFARHLKDSSNPIYDQHAIRSVWAICHQGFNSEEKNKCKGLLFDGKGKWKQTGTGQYSVDCYKIFLTHIDSLANENLSKREIDLLLMPLGQALKDNSKNYDDFCYLCGWDK
ncbi:hypothetical protein [Methylobacter psychrophilus]|uniref:hypothetical protein n=1 Tax=Methylobacter psychrophilus TaxID=96941 RepID=UPI0021D4D5B4|nr:hypothetical protein [Methylobacter psychrophilus]